MTVLLGESLEERYYDSTLFKRILSYLKPYRLMVAGAIALLFSVSILNLAGPYLTKVAIDDHITVSNYEGLDTLALIYLAVLAGA